MSTCPASAAASAARSASMPPRFGSKGQECPWHSSGEATTSAPSSPRPRRVPRLARTALLALLPAALIATGWRQLELPPEGRELGLVALFGIGVALLPRRSLQIAGAVGACLVTAQLAFGLRPVRGVF